MAGIAPLLPGLTTYRGLLELTVDARVHGLLTLLSAVSIGLALAAGVGAGRVPRPAGPHGAGAARVAGRPARGRPARWMADERE